MFTFPIGHFSSSGAAVWSDISTSSYASKSYNFSTQVTVCECVAFNDDGTKMYLAKHDYPNIEVHQYTLSTAWDVSTASYASKSLSLFAEKNAIQGIFFKPDGTEMYSCDRSSNKVHQYTLSTAWDVSTGSYASKFIDTSSTVVTPASLYMHPDGTSMYVTASGGIVYQYTLSTAWDVSSASYASKSYTTTGVNNECNTYFSIDGVKMYANSRNAPSSVNQYTLSTPWDVSTASSDSNTFDNSSQDAFPSGITFSGDGTNWYLVANTPNIYQYNL